MAVNHQLTTTVEQKRVVEHFNASGGFDGVHWKVFLWPDRSTFHEKMTDGIWADGLHHPHAYYRTGMLFWRKHKPLKVIGSIHFVRGKWDMEVVSHECLHAVSHYVRATGATPLGDRADNMTAEEKLCYPFGKLVDEIYRKLWELDNAT